MIRDGIIPSEFILEITNVELAREMGWSLEYVENMECEKRNRVFAIVSGLNSSGNASSKKANKMLRG